MGSTRKNYPASFKVKVALAQLASECSVHTNQIQQWKKRVLSEASSLFSHRRSKAERDAEELQSELYRQIGQLKVEVSSSLRSVHNEREAPQRYHQKEDKNADVLTSKKVHRAAGGGCCYVYPHVVRPYGKN